MEKARTRILALTAAAPDAAFADIDTIQLRIQAGYALTFAEARKLTGEIIRRLPRDHFGYSRLAWFALSKRPKNYGERQKRDRLALEAALAAAMLADRPADESYALQLAAVAYQNAYRHKIGIRALRRAVELAPDEKVEATLAKLVASHGFRVLSNKIESDTARPRLCLTFSDKVAASLAETNRAGDYLRVSGPDATGDHPVSVNANQVCVAGLRHGGRYSVVARAGLPAEDGERLFKDVTTRVLVRDRTPFARFDTRAYVVPAGNARATATVPVTSLNADKLELAVHRIDPRALTNVRENLFKALDGWDATKIEKDASPVWSGTMEVERRLNRETVTAVPVADMTNTDMAPGLYLMTAKVAGTRAQDYEKRATQWFLVSDIGLTTFAADDGLHVIARSLGAAAPMGDVEVTLVARNNRVLATARTDTTGHVRIAPGLMRGTGGDRPAVLTARIGETDFAFLDMTATPFDLTDRGVSGRAAPVGGLDTFIASERGVYRPGATVHITATVRDLEAKGRDDLTLTGIVKRPDGKEHARVRLSTPAAGGLAWSVPLPEAAMRGAWTFALHTDPGRPALASAKVRVADFEPERLDFTLSGPTALDPSTPSAILVDARYLFGAPAARLNASGAIRLTPVREIEGFEKFRFGLASDETRPGGQALKLAKTDERGRVALSFERFEPPATTRPLEARATVTLTDTNGRPVERTLDMPLKGEQRRIGIRPRFEDRVGEGETAGFDVIAIEGDERVALDTRWKLERITTDYQWYRVNGTWNYEPVRTRSIVAQGEGVTGTDDALDIARSVTWGSYELTVEADGALPASVGFSSGWRVEAKAGETPAVARITLDKETYRVGDTAKVFIEPRFAGPAEVLVMDGRVVSRTLADLPAEGGTVEVPVTGAWGPSAYVTAVVYRPMDIANRAMPGRAIGTAHAAVDPGEHRLDVSLDMESTIRPRRDLPVTVRVAGLAEGETAYLTLAMVDEGVLNITGHEPPAPSKHYFGQRRLGVAIRDLYSRLIDRMAGAKGTVRSGGDGGGSDYRRPPVIEQVVARFSGLVETDADGTALVTFAVPDFNGSLRFDAVAWSKTGVGEATAKVVARDPVVVSAVRPTHLAPGDAATFSIEATNVDAPAGPITMALEASGPVALTGDTSFSLDIERGKRADRTVTVRALSEGDASFRLTTQLADGTRLAKTFTMPVRSLAPDVVRVSSIPLAPGGKLTLDANVTDGFSPGTAQATVTVAATAFDVGGILRRLDDYQYRCTEQRTSRAFPLVSLPRNVAEAALADRAGDIAKRVDEAVAGILANQSTSGSFGLWRPGSTSLWLDAYATDFLTRARDAGYGVEETALRAALTNLENGLSYATDAADLSGPAYAAYVLARAGRASIGDLRYRSDNVRGVRGNTNGSGGGAVATPLALAHLAGALSLYGERERALELAREAVRRTRAVKPATRFVDFGSDLRDGAAVIAVALESDLGEALDGRAMARNIAASRMTRDYFSTQENAWSLLAAAALMRNDPPQLTVAGAAHEGAFLRTLGADALADGLDVANRGDTAVTATVSVRGRSLTPPPAVSRGYRLSRRYLTLDGKPADLSTIERGTRLVAVLEVVPLDGEAARVLLEDPLPAGFAIDNPNLLRAGDVSVLGLKLETTTTHQEFRADRFVAAFDRKKGDTSLRRFAYIVRAVTPGSFEHPGAVVESMYAPEKRGRTEAGRVTIR